MNITNWIPYPFITGAPLRSYNLLRRFSQEHEVYLAAFADTNENSTDVDQLLDICHRVETVVPNNLKKPFSVSTIINLFSKPGPLELRMSYSEELAAKIHQLASTTEFDVVQIEHGSMGLYIDALPPSLRRRSIWMLHDIDFDKFNQIHHIETDLCRKFRFWLFSMMMKRWQHRFAEKFALCVTVSEADSALLLAANPHLSLEVSPNGVDTKLYDLLTEESPIPSLLFIGNMGYAPNIDGIAYFCSQIFPLIRKDLSDSDLWIVGTNPTSFVDSLKSDVVHVTGRVEDVRPYYRRSKVCVVPLRAGSGTRLKILEAMALGRPVVSTSVGCHGLDMVDGKHLFIADSPKQFAQRTLELLTDTEIRHRMVVRAREHVVKNYDWDVIAKNLLLTFANVTNRSQSDC